MSFAVTTEVNCLGISLLCDISLISKVQEEAARQQAAHTIYPGKVTPMGAIAVQPQVMPPPQMQRPPVGSIGPYSAHLIPTIDQWRYVQLMLLFVLFMIYSVGKILVLWAICLSKKTHGSTSHEDYHVNGAVTEYCKLLVSLFVCLFLSFFQICLLAFSFIRSMRE
jgi:hypothetical protein